MVARIFIAILVAGVVGAISGQSQRRAFEWDRVKAIYAFGDSYSFVGGLRGYPKFTFIGDEINFAFTPEELLTNTILPNVTSSGGNNWLQFLTGCYQGSPFDCPKQLWDFAFAGADIDVKQLPLHANFVTSLVRQVEQFLAYADPVLPKQQPDESLIVWWIGINDVSDVVNNRTITDFPAFWDPRWNRSLVQSTRCRQQSNLLHTCF
ncbi:hypothetical protein BKA62DRAFT_74534 [Auriculariales sp. MPI-PUGE-AT-0066]|nr:hypothetical protein BKA62DRAFT_74534 [Auriculariales sp. MPI-PUGE-AT-0066]